MIRTSSPAPALHHMPAMLLVLLLCAPAFAQPAAGPFAGRPLADALRALQANGLRVVFTTELVTSEMRVAREPRATSPRDLLVELLRPHGLGVVDGPGGLALVVRERRQNPAPRVPPAPPAPRAPTTSAVEPPGVEAGTYRERVTVEATPDLRSGSSAYPDHRLSSSDLATFGSYTVDDPVRTAQTLGGGAVGGDYRNDLSVRGSAPHHAAIVVEGVAVPWLQHTAFGREGAGAVTMLGNDAVAEAALHVGGYARQDGSHLGPQLNLTLREGNRSAPRFRFGASTAGATVVGDGPLGSRGSWLASVRRSHVEWPIGRQDHAHTVFGYTDLQSKLVYDVGPTQQVSAVVVAGLSSIERDDPAPLALADGTNRASLTSLVWRSIVGSQTVIRQQASWLAHGFANWDNARQVANRGTDSAAAYRVDLTRPVFGALFEAGGQVRRLGGSRRDVRPVISTPTGLASRVPEAEATWLERSAHVSVRWLTARGLTLAPGVRLTHSTLVGRAALDRWLEAQWAPASRWVVHGNLAVVHQFADFEYAAGWSASAGLAPERAVLAEVGLGLRVTPAVHWRGTVFVRRERDLLSTLDPWLPGQDDDLVSARGVPSRADGLTGRARGFELVMERRASSGVSGWVGYAYGIARTRDEARDETYRADGDQRHVLTASAAWLLPRGPSLGLTFRAGSRLPIPGYVASHDGRLVLSERRNEAMLPAYARLDVRADYPVRALGCGLHLYAEVLNLFNRANYGLTSGSLVRETGEVVGATERLYPRLAVAGVRIAF